MASQNCWRCLSRPSQRLVLFAPTPAPLPLPSTSTAAAFSTSAHHLAKAADTGAGRHVRAGKKLTLGKKKKQQTSFKAPAIGERKAFRKRIQLSNDNALKVPGLHDLTADALLDSDSVGTVASIPAPVVDQLRICEGFKSSQNWNLFHSPHMLVRAETVELAKQMTDAVSKKETLRLVVTGDRGSGKSILGLQALATGFLNNWVVMHLPEGQELTNASTEYSTIHNSELFSQPVYAVKLMQAMLQTNQAVLSQHKVQLDHLHLPISLSRSMTLAQVLAATKEPDFAWPVFRAFWKELLLPGRPPILFSLDGLAHIMRISEYRSPAFQLIHSHDLGIVSMFADALGGKTTFPNGAAVIGVKSKGNAPIIPSMDKAIAQASAAQKGEAIPPRDPLFRKYDDRVFESLKGVRVLEVQGVSRTEARSLMEYWAASGILRSRVDEKHVTEKWTMAGRGIVSEMERVSLFDLRST
ncbi:mitochondrial ribosomal death-associated protein 3-domain-containing protein [Xylariaceae sp. FL1272]|nr:mitochondrial ribosomal death-associated protein 3-domain-containing protein [Xylariaceae sp. FL1272]